MSRLDFYRICARPGKRKNSIELYPGWDVRRSKDLMVRGKDFYAVWDETNNTWSRDPITVQRIVDQDLWNEKEKREKKYAATPDFEPPQITVKSMQEYSSHSWRDFKAYLGDLPDNVHQLDDKVTFKSQEVKKEDYRSKRLPYDPLDIEPEAWNELVGTLYDQEERDKIEWAIGSVLCGEATQIQKFVVFYGAPGCGKGTIIDRILDLFGKTKDDEGYTTTFNAQDLVGKSNNFATEMFKDNPLVAVQTDGDMSRIEDNTKLNTIVSHESMVINPKGKTQFTAKINAFLFLASNKPVKITDGKSGLLRRLLVVEPSGRRIESHHYDELVNATKFELGAIAGRCMRRYRELGGKTAYNKYEPKMMRFKTDAFFNFVESYFQIFSENEYTTASSAYDNYCKYCADNGLERRPSYIFREELKNYFDGYSDMKRIDGKLTRKVYWGFKKEKFYPEETPEKTENHEEAKVEGVPDWLEMKEQTSAIDEVLKDCPAQYCTEDGSRPLTSWDACKTTLKDLDTRKLHFVRTPATMIEVDLDIRDPKTGEKDPKLNLKAAAEWKPTYAERSKGGAGIHLHYWYFGDVKELVTDLGNGIEVKVSTGLFALRRKLTTCNNHEVATITGGLPVKVKPVLSEHVIQNEKHLRTRIKQNLKKENGSTRCSIDFIYKDLDQAYLSGMHYDVTDLRPAIRALAAKSTHQSAECLKITDKMQFRGKAESEYVEPKDDAPIVFFDIEVYPNLCLVCFMYQGTDVVYRLYNPTPEDVKPLLKCRLIGFNNLKYDNVILKAIVDGYTIKEIWLLSRRIIDGSDNVSWREARHISYTDVYDYCSKKQSLKTWEDDLDFPHAEMDLDWNEPAPEDQWERIGDYCENDVRATAKVHEANVADWTARQVLAKLARHLTGKGSTNSTTNELTALIILRGDKDAKREFVYPDLAEKFHGYTFIDGKSQYMGVDPKEGGWVYAQPGVHFNVTTFDIASMHPSSMIAENAFGKYTQNLKDLLYIRLCIKHGTANLLYGMYDGVLDQYLDDPKIAKQLSYALKIAINSVYGLTAAHFDNAFRDPRNVDNWVAKRGSLFMITLKNKVEELGAKVVHIKTDSIKIENPSKEVADFIMDFGKQYGYTFEIESEYEKMCLVNDAVYVAKEKGRDWSLEDSTTGKQFAVPYVFKTLFSHEQLTLHDYSERKRVTTAMYLDMNERLPEGVHDYRFVGKVGRFVPIKPGCGGGELRRKKDDKYDYVTGAKGWRWKLLETVQNNFREDDIDMRYFEKLADDARNSITKYCEQAGITFEQFAA